MLKGSEEACCCSLSAHAHFSPCLSCLFSGAIFLLSPCLCLFFIALFFMSLFRSGLNVCGLLSLSIQPGFSLLSPISSWSIFFLSHCFCLFNYLDCIVSPQVSSPSLNHTTARPPCHLFLHGSFSFSLSLSECRVFSRLPFRSTVTSPCLTCSACLNSFWSVSCLHRFLIFSCLSL